METGNVESMTRIFRDGKLIFEGKPQKASSDKPRPKAFDVAGALMLGAEMEPGDYVLQIVITDKLAKEKYNSASQFVQFELLP